MSSWISSSKGGSGKYAEKPQPRPHKSPRPKTPEQEELDKNIPLRRLQLQQRCLYERTLPGDVYISAHVNRLQHGYYDSKLLHEPPLDNVYFVSVHFVFHAHDHRAHRIRSAVIRVSVHDDVDPTEHHGHARHRRSRLHPRILGHAPKLIYGGISPENLQWNFSLSSSLGVSHAPIAASVKPYGGVQSNYKVYDMMSIQGSLRSLPSQSGPEYDAQDAMAVWTLEENLLQRSGLPREFDFVLLVHNPAHAKDVHLSVDVDAKVEAWLGPYPQWYQNLSRFLPTQDRTIDFRSNIGQKFLPLQPGRGFNFANLPHPLQEYVSMPGTTYPTNATSKPDDTGAQRPETLDQLYSDPGPFGPGFGPPEHYPPCGRGERDLVQAFNANRHSLLPETVNIRVLHEHSSSVSAAPHNSSKPFANNWDADRQSSVRRTKSRSRLKEHGGPRHTSVTAERC